MSDNTEQLIARLADTAEPLRAVRLRTLSLRWIGGFVAYAALLIAITGVAENFAAAFTHPLFAIELALLGALVISAVFASAILAFPDRYQRSRFVWLPFVLAIALIALLVVDFNRAPIQMPPLGHGYECLSCISLYALLPGAWLLFQLRTLASTHAGMAGAMALISSFSMGALALRVKESTDDVAHVLVWHYLPTLLVAALGVVLGRRLLKW